jgi:tetratricopeptide (TPR) repeat protein
VTWFRRLGVHPGTDIDGYAAAALDGTGLATARRHLDGLYDQYLLTEPARGRYRLHDLLREHAGGLAADDPADAGAAAGRLLDYYLHTAAAAGQHIATRHTPVVRPPPGEPPAVAPRLSTAGQALAWLDAERSNLHAAAGYAAASGRPGHAIAIPAAISGFLFARGHWDQSAVLHQAALATARQAGDRAGQADALNELGLLQWATGDHPAAAVSVTRALELYRGLGDRLGQASAMDKLGRVQFDTGDYPAAAASQQQALDLFRDLGHRLGQALALTNLGIMQLRTGDYPAAIASLTQALGMFRELGDRYHQAEVLNDLGDMLSRSGDSRQARDQHARALAIAREISAPLEEARALEGLGHCLLQDGNSGDAAAHWQQALTIYQRLGAPDARRLQDTLRQHGITTAPPPPGGQSRQPGAPTAP